MQERLRDQLSRLPRAVAFVVMGGAFLLAAVAVGLTIALFSGVRPTAVASAIPSVSAVPTASARIRYAVPALSTKPDPRTDRASS